MNLGGRSVHLILGLFLSLTFASSAWAQDDSYEIVVERYARLRYLPSVASETRFQFPAYARVQTKNFDGTYWYVEYKEYKGYIIDSAVEASDELRETLLNAVSGHLLDEDDIAYLEALKKAPGTIDPSIVLAGDPNLDPSLRRRILSDKGFVIGLSGGRAAPIQPPSLSDYWKASIQGAGHIGYRFNTVFEIHFEFSTVGLPIDEEPALLELNDDNRNQELDESLRISTGFLNLKFHMGGYKARVSPYIFFGGGVFSFKASDGDFVYVESSPPEFLFLEDENVPGFNLGFGSAFRINGPLYFNLEGSVLFGVTRNEGTLMLPIKAGLSLLL